MKKCVYVEVRPKNRSPMPNKLAYTAVNNQKVLELFMKVLELFIERSAGALSKRFTRERSLATLQ